MNQFELLDQLSESCSNSDQSIDDDLILSQDLITIEEGISKLGISGQNNTFDSIIQPLTPKKSTNNNSKNKKKYKQPWLYKKKKNTKVDELDEEELAEFMIKASIKYFNLDPPIKCNFILIDREGVTTRHGVCEDELEGISMKNEDDFGEDSDRLNEATIVKVDENRDLCTFCLDGGCFSLHPKPFINILDNNRDL